MWASTCIILWVGILCFSGSVLLNSLTDLECEICIVVDSNFFKFYGGGQSSKTNQSSRGHIIIESVIDKASWLFRVTDWDEDGIPNNIGVRLKQINVGWSPYKNETSVEYMTRKSPLVLLKEFGKLEFNECCLGLGFTMRPFKGKQVGASFKARNDILGGICEYRQPDPSSGMKSSNVILISGIGPKGRPLKVQDLTQVLFHELGHAFGADSHDDEGLYRREGVNSTEGHHIMWDRASQGQSFLKRNNVGFSLRSKRQIGKLLQSRQDQCLVPSQEAFCGNGILENDEECDCGDPFNCEDLKCCGSRDGEKPCKVLPGFQQSQCKVGFPPKRKA